MVALSHMKGTITDEKLYEKVVRISRSSV